MICPLCYRPTVSVACPWCNLRGRHFVGQDAAVPVDTPVSSTTSDYQKTSWDDLQLLAPGGIIPWAVGKAMPDPSSMPDPQIKRNQLAAVAKQLNTVVGTHTSVPQATRTAWDNFGKEFALWFNRDVSFLDRSADNEQAESYQNQLRDWQIEIGKYADIGMPLLPKASPTASELAQDALDTIKKGLGTVTLVTVAMWGGIVFVMYMLGKNVIRKGAGRIVG